MPRRYVLLICSLFAALMAAPNILTAKHIIGGDVIYECAGLDTINNRVTFNITFTMYRDCNDPTGAPFDSDAEFGIWRRSGGSWVFVRKTAPLNFADFAIVEPNANPCLIVPPNVCVERAAYRFTVTLDIIDSEYLIAYQRCCRNNTITNIQAPGATGAVFSVQISPEAQRTCNNSPQFKAFPPIVICAGFDLEFDHSATDADGDQLVYSFCTPVSAGGQIMNNPNSCSFVKPDPARCGPEEFSDIRFVLPTFNTNEPLGGDPVVTLNVNSGLISGVPTMQGQFVVGVCVREFRGGQQIGEVRRDFQFNVTSCEPAVSAQLQADQTIGPKDFVINACGINTVDFINLSTDVSFIDEYAWTFDINGVDQTFDTRNATVTFPGLGEYEGTMILNPGTECSDTANIFVNVFPEITADFEFDYDTCVAGPIDFVDRSTTGADFLTDWSWDFMDGERSDQANTQHQYESPGFKDVLLQVTDSNGCIDTVIHTVDWRPVPPLIVVEPTTFIGCLPADIFFNNLSMPIDETYDITWDFGDGQTGTEISPTHTYEEEGTYTVSLEIISPIGCRTSRTFPNWIRIQAKPTADFAFSPDVLNSFIRTANFFDQSTDASGLLWNFNDEASSFAANPSHTFRDTGLAFIDLIAIHANGCVDSARKWIDIIPEAIFHMPNAFTPNGDATNDLFLGTGFLDGARDFRMTIWSRWGELLFETTDPMQGWNGRKNNSGALLPGGVYVYLVQYVDPRGRQEELKGFATLVR